jgi:hypothetical protein
MIEFIATQDTKPLIKDKYGIEIYDFLEADISVIDDKQPPTGIDYYLVTKDTQMRIDLITKAMYGYIDPIEKVLKFNEICNPLAIDENDILIVYDLYSLTRNIRDTSQSAKNKMDVRKQYLAPEKDSRIDPKLQAFDKRNKGKKPVDTSLSLPPNYADFGDKEIEIRNGKIYFGPNVSKTQKTTEDPLSKSEFIARLVKNRLNNR